MTLDASTAVPAPSRRSSRTVAAPAPQPERALTRAELRRRAAQNSVAQTSIPDDATAAPAAAADAATADAVQTHAAEFAAFMVAAAAVELPAALANSATVIGSDEGAAAGEVPAKRDAPAKGDAAAKDDAAAKPAPTVCSAAAATGAPTSRRARRAAAHSRPAETFTLAPVTASVPVVRAPADETTEPSSPFRAAVTADACDSEADTDEFERAARLFCFAETPVAVAAAARDQPSSPTPLSAHDAPAPRWAVARKRLAAASISIGAMSVVGLLAVGLTTPAGAVSTTVNAEPLAAASTSLAATTASEEEEEKEIQAFVSSAATQDLDLARHETYSTATMADLAAGSGVRNFDNSFLNNPNSPVQWPFPVGVPYTWGFQMRDGSMHHGVDFVPGGGAAIQSIADGTVRVATEAGGLFGVHVVIDHVIDGELVSSHYAHMEYGSLRVEAGDTVKVGDVLGTVGDTGYSFGAHLHFEIWQNGTTKIDPLEWMREHTAG